MVERGVIDCSQDADHVNNEAYDRCNSKHNKDEAQPAFTSLHVRLLLLIFFALLSLMCSLPREPRSLPQEMLSHIVEDWIVHHLRWLLLLLLLLLH